MLWTYRRAKSRLHADRLAVCRVLKEGPVCGDDVASQLGWSLEKFWRVIEGATGLVRVTGKGYALTSAGREAIR